MKEAISRLCDGFLFGTGFWIAGKIVTLVWG